MTCISMDDSANVTPMLTVTTISPCAVQIGLAEIVRLI
jgi:hypothetical protein